MDLNRDAMLVGLRITAWSGRLYDREASNHVAAHHDAAASAGRYNKRLLPKVAFAALTATMSEARTKHYENSLPWDDKGARLLTVANYEHYTGLMDGLRERVVRQRARFIDDYDDYVDQARLDLGKLFRIEDYPSKEALQGKFAIRYRITPVPDADHFIAKLASDDTDRVKRDIERHIEEQLHDAVGDLYRRLSHPTHLRRMARTAAYASSSMPSRMILRTPVRACRAGNSASHLRRSPATAKYLKTLPGHLAYTNTRAGLACVAITSWTGMRASARGYDPSRRASLLRRTTGMRTVMNRMRNRDAASGRARIAGSWKRPSSSTIEETAQGKSA